MNNWFRVQLEDIFTYHITLKEADITQLLDNIADMMATRRHVVAPKFLSDEMYSSIKEHCPFLEYNEASKVYIAALDRHLKE